MAKIQADQPLVPSVLDRLLDERDDRPTRSRSQVLRDIKQAVRRDLENLLNTRWRGTPWPPELTELETSLVNYGIPDFTGANMSLMSERERLRQIVEQVVRRFEPRFKTARVIVLNNRDPADRTLRFRIDALLHAEPAPEPVVFDSELEPVSGNFEVRSQAGERAG